MDGDGGIRIGDAERRQVDQQLQRATGAGLLTLGEYDERSAVVWAARTRADLAVVTADLPEGGRAVTAAQARSKPVGPVGPTGSGPADSRRAQARWAVAVLSEQRLSGPVLPGQRSHSVAVLGHGLIDLRRSDLPPVVNVWATAVMGTVEVLVPEGVRVEANGIALMGARDVQVAPGLPGAPLVRVHATAVMGHVEVRHKRLGRKDARREGMTHRLDGESSPQAADADLMSSDRNLDRDLDRDRDRRQRHLAGRRHRHRGGKIGIVAGVLILLAGGAVTAAATGDQVVAFSDQTITVSAAKTQVKVANFFGNTTVQLQPGHCASVTGIHLFSSVENHLPCSSGQTPVAVRADGAFGDVDIVEAQP